MFRIADGREQFYQWDLDRQVIVDDPSIVEVHFCNRTDDCSLVTEVIDGKANVPNILLQSSFDIRVFGYDGKATMHDKKFKVNARTRPADYVYTETEVLSIQKLEEDLRKEIDERLTAVEEGLITDGFATMEYVDKAIEDNCNAYVLKNPGYNKKVTDERTIEFLEFCWAGELRPAAIDGHLIHRFTKEAVSKNELQVYYQVLLQYDVLCEYRVFFTRYSEGDWRGGTTAQFARNTFVRRTSQLENDSDFTTKAYVDNAIANIEIPESGGDVDLSDYYTKAETEALIDAVEIPSLDGYATETYVANAITTAFAGIATAEGGSY